MHELTIFLLYYHSRLSKRKALRFQHAVHHRDTLDSHPWGCSAHNLMSDFYTACFSSLQLTSLVPSQTHALGHVTLIHLQIKFTLLPCNPDPVLYNMITSKVYFLHVSRISLWLAARGSCACWKRKAFLLESLLVLWHRRLCQRSLSPKCLFFRRVVIDFKIWSACLAVVTTSLLRKMRHLGTVQNLWLGGWRFWPARPVKN